jgi:hypothetical protein
MNLAYRSFGRLLYVLHQFVIGKEFVPIISVQIRIRPDVYLLYLIILLFFFRK